LGILETLHHFRVVAERATFAIISPLLILIKPCLTGGIIVKPGRLFTQSGE